MSYQSQISINRFLPDKDPEEILVNGSKVIEEEGWIRILDEQGEIAFLAKTDQVRYLARVMESPPLAEPSSA